MVTQMERTRTTLASLPDSAVMAMVQALRSREECVSFHDYIAYVRSLLDGTDSIEIPVSHQSLSVGENHEGGHRLNVRIKQAAAWLNTATIRFSVTPSGAEFHQQAELMERVARGAERQINSVPQLHQPKREANRDLFECGVSVLQDNPRKGYYLQATADPSRFIKGSRMTDVFHRRRVDPATWFWKEGNDGQFSQSMILGRRELANWGDAIQEERLDNLIANFDWAETVLDGSHLVSGKTVEVAEVWWRDEDGGVHGALVVTDNGTTKRHPLAQNATERIAARWTAKRMPFYVAAAGPSPWHSPLDEMIALTEERNFWATMLDLQAAGAIFRHWQLKDTQTGDNIAAELWNQPVPENVLLDMSKPPPFMGPGTEWVLAPFEFFDVVPRYAQIVQAHENAGASVARLMGQMINQNTAVGTADQMEEYARREFSEVVEAVQTQYAAIWKDRFEHIRATHSNEPVVVAWRQRSADGEMKFRNILLELRGADVVAEEVECIIDTRSRLSMFADYQYGRMARSNGDMSFDRAVEHGLVPYVDDAEEEKLDIFRDQIENTTLEVEVMAHAQEVQQNLAGGPVPGTQQPPWPNVTSGVRKDPRGSGAGQGPDNITNVGNTPMERAAG